jgi:LuxR family transcriptional regulator, activator of conjugal transfer of Ti plasmids
MEMAMALRAPASDLTPRERECLLWVARGKTYVEIGVILDLKFPSVKNHLDHCRYKLGCSSLAQATAVAMALGILTADDLISR